MKLRQRIAQLIGGKEYQNSGVEFTPELEALILNGPGGRMDWQTAIQVSTVLSCARVYAEDLCSVPWKIMRDMPGGSKQEDRDHPLWDIVTSSPNSWQTSFEFRKTMGFHLALTGNAFVWLDRVGPRSERIVGLLPIDPNSVDVRRSDADWTKLEYHVTFPDGAHAVVDSRYIWHIKNHSWDSYKGLSALSYARTAIGLAKSIETGQTETHSNFARPSGVLSVDQEMDAGQFAKMRALIDRQVQTRLSKGFPLVVDKTMSWTQTAIKAVDAQTVETRKFQVEDIARQMGILPIMIGHSDKATTYASAEQMFLHHFKTSTRVSHTNFMTSADRWLLSKRERRDGRYNLLVDQSLLQADTKARGEFYRLLWMIGVVTGNEIRAWEDLDRLDGLDRPWAPIANAPIGEDGMPMVAEKPQDANSALSDSNAIEQLGEAFKNASPMAQQKFLSQLRNGTRTDQLDESGD